MRLATVFLDSCTLQLTKPHKGLHRTAKDLQKDRKGPRRTTKDLDDTADDSHDVII